MGCDIHAHIEYQEYGKWWHYAHVRLWRWYDLFAFMATGGSSRRPHIQPVFAPRGLPNDIEETTRYYHEDDSRDYTLHHTSWLTLDEMRDVRKAYIQWYADIYPNNDLPKPADYDACYAAMGCLEGAGYRTRLLFWFDN